MVTVKTAVFRLYTGFAMPRISRLKLPPVDLGGETIGERVARLRKERGYTQVELAEKVGIIQTIVSAIETNALKLSAEMAVRFALVLGVSTDDLLMPVKKNRHSAKPSRKVLRRLELIESLPMHQQQTVLKTIDTMLKGLRSAS
ncbi:MAG: helix-turn-helix transcriptional regulator [Bryobacteraceae bacterium]|jgi:transcriptional regulator with XRE-family HTH domain